MRARVTENWRALIVPGCLLLVIAAYSTYDAETVRVAYGLNAARSVSDAIFAVWGSPLVLGNVWIPFVLLSSVLAILRSQHPSARIRFGSLGARVVAVGVVRVPMHAAGAMSAGVLVTVLVASASSGGTDAAISAFHITPFELFVLGLGLVCGTTLISTVLVTTVSLTNRGGAAIPLAIACWLYSALLSLQAFPVLPVLTPWYWFRVDQPGATPATLVSYTLSVLAVLIGCVVASQVADGRIQRRTHQHA